MKESQKAMDDMKKKQSSGIKAKALNWYTSRQELSAISENDGCNPLFERMIKDMFEDHIKDKDLRSALVVVNSFDNQKEDIEDVLENNRVYADVMEIDRLNKEDREEYLLCFNKMYKTRHLPMIFVGDKMVANGYSSYRDLN